MFCHEKNFVRKIVGQKTTLVRNIFCLKFCLVSKVVHISLSLKFGGDWTSGCWELSFFYLRSSSFFLLEVVFIWFIFIVWFGHISLSLKFEEDRTSGCWDAPLLGMDIYVIQISNISSGVGGWVGGYRWKIMPLSGPILKAGICKIFSWAEIQDRSECGKIPRIVATFVSASSQGQRTHSALTNFR